MTAFGLRPRLRAVAMPRFSEFDVHVEGRLVDIDEHRRRAGQRHRLAGRAERERRTEHRVAAADALGHQHHQQRIGAAGAGHDMLGAADRPQARPRAAVTSGPLMNWQCVSTRLTASSIDVPSRRRCAAMSMNGTGSGRRCWFMEPGCMGLAGLARLAWTGI